MGELSRTIGELGENIVIENVFKKFGWKGIPNLDIPCVLKDKHKRREHCIDFYSTYKDPLVVDTLSHIYTSVKYNESKNIKSDFIDFADSIVKSSECIKYNTYYTNSSRGLNLSKKRNSCVIFWLNHSSDETRSLLKYLAEVNSQLNGKFESIYLVDNYRLTFIYKSISFIENLYPTDTLEFVYHATGMNESIDGGRELAGKVLPVEFINSPVLPLRVTLKNSLKILILCLNEPFDEESLRRMMGLSQGLTSGWCSKIILCFPDYQSSKHNQIKDVVFMSFSENNFSDMVEVKSFNPSFKSLEKNEDVDYSSLLEKSHENININTMLPFGDRIRQLLVQSYIYKQDLQTLLNRRGVYIDKYASKSELIPLISKTLLSPSEFEYLRRKQIKKENAEKISTQNLPISEGTTHEHILPLLQVAIDRIILENNYNCKLIGSPSFELDASGNISLKFQITREDLTKDWTKSTTPFDGNLIIKPAQTNSEGDYLRIDTISTSNETKLICKNIVEDIIKQLKQEGLVSTATQSKKLLANELTSRSNFLYSFISQGNKISKVLMFKELTNIEFKIANNTKGIIPEDVESLKNKVDKSIFSGHSLQEIKYVSDIKYRDIFDYYIMTCLFSIRSSYFTGHMQIEFGFPDLKSKSDDKAEFEFKILEIKPSDNEILTARTYHEVELSIREDFHAMKDKAYQLADKRPQQLNLAL